MLSHYKIKDAAVYRDMRKDSIITLLAFVVSVCTSCLCDVCSRISFQVFEIIAYISLAMAQAPRKCNWPLAVFPFYINCSSASSKYSWQKRKEIISHHWPRSIHQVDAKDQNRAGKTKSIL